MTKNKLGSIRRSQIHQNGPGAIIDFISGEKGGGPVSAICCSLESWGNKKDLNILNDPCIITEPRLQKKLKKDYFRLPPVEIDDSDKQYTLKAVRFPNWLLCPKCFSLKTHNKWDKEIGDPSRWCSKCSTKNNRVFVVPTRFVLVCENGHISDFPWILYLNTFSKKNPEVKKCNQACQLKLRSDGRVGLAGLMLSCTVCKQETNFKNIFSKEIFANLPCLGERPWIGDKEECKASVRVIQRGASNIYYAEIESALSIPPWTETGLVNKLGDSWNAFKKTSDINERKLFVKILYNAKSLPGYKNMSEEEVFNYLEDKRKILEGENNIDLERDEYETFMEGTYEENSLNKTDNDFQIKYQEISESLKPYLSKLIKVERLREIKVQTGFSRLHPPQKTDSEEDRKACSPLSNKELNWLPAVEIRGEGIFFSLNKESFNNWIFNNNEIISRTEKIKKAYLVECERRKLEPNIEVSANFLLLHTLSHALINQIAFDAGYNAASIKEKIYAKSYKDKKYSSHGILIYTGSSDSDGTLGGLARLSSAVIFEKLIKSAIMKISWCAQDPICIHGISTISESLNLAACHCCVLVPETSCQPPYFNRFLDRAFLVGTPEKPESGFFSAIVNKND